MRFCDPRRQQTRHGAILRSASVVADSIQSRQGRSHHDLFASAMFDGYWNEASVKGFHEVRVCIDADSLGT